MDKASVSFVGDISFGTGSIRLPEFGESWPNTELLRILDSNLIVGNLECVFVDESFEITNDSLCVSDKAVNFLSRLKVNAVSLANNHMLDGGVYGLKHTIEILKNNRIDFFGAGTNLDEACRPAIFNINGLRIGIIGRLHKDFFSKSVDAMGATNSRPGIALLDEAVIADEAQKYREQYQLDQLILYVHWGIEHVNIPHPRIAEITKNILKQTGIDLVIGSHTHCIQGVISDSEKFACFGLGNFFFYPKQTHFQPIFFLESNQHPYSLIVKVEFLRPRVSLSYDICVQNEDLDFNILHQSDRLAFDKKITDKWSKTSNFAFFMTYRISMAVQFWKKLKSLFVSDYYQKKLIYYFKNPKKLAGYLFQLFFGRYA